MTKAWDELTALIGEAGLRITFSLHCRSGIVGDMCKCWRCRGLPGASSDESAAERDAALIDIATGRKKAPAPVAGDKEGT